MKRYMTMILVVLLMLPILSQTVPSPESYHTPDPFHSEVTDTDTFVPSESSGLGDNLSATAIMSRTLSGQNLSILNTYASPTKHNGTVDLSEYQIPGWTLYNTTLDIESLTAAPERQTVGVNGETWDFKIYKDGLGRIYAQIAQGFYDESQNGLLLNYSIFYDTARYDPDVNNPAYFVIRESHNVSTSNMTTPSIVPIATTASWHTEKARVNLTAKDTYYLVLDGRELVEGVSGYPEIRWRTESSAGQFMNYIWQEGTGNWDPVDVEALLNYTYTPWNQTSNTPLTFNATELSLRANQTPVDGNRVSFETPGNNITLLEFDSNQSAYMGYNMTLWYSKALTTGTVWEAPESGQDILWNQTLTLEYPSLEHPNVASGEVERIAVLSKMSDWSATGLYNGTSTESYEHYSVNPINVVCSDMTNGTWTLTLTAPNYVDAIDTYDSADDSVLAGDASILVDMDINTTIADGSSNPADTGSTTLTIMHEGEETLGPNNKSVSDGKTHYFWNINETTQDNGTYTIEVYWANGTEAGYLVKEMVVFYPTSLTAEDYSIHAYTEDSFPIRVQFNDTYNDAGLNDSVASVVYSFDGETNQTMTDHDNGTWTATVDTTGRSAGSHTVEVFGEEFAIENQSLSISVDLIHDTEPLVVDWENGANITYVERTTLLVNYSLFNGTPVEDATVNVTIDSNTWNLTWNGTSSFYDLRFNGTDDPPGLGTHSLTISAWKVGYEGQLNTSYSLTIREAPTNLQLEWFQTNTITYTENSILRANYTMPNGTSIENAWVNVTTGTYTWNLTWNETSSFYELVFNGTDEETGLGTHNLTIKASRHKYEAKSESPPDLTINTEPTSIWVDWSPSNLTIDTTELLNLTVNYTYDGNPVPDDAIVNVTVDTNVYDLIYNESHWIVSIPGGDFQTGVYNASIEAWRYGFAEATDLTEDINITLAISVFSTSWKPTNQNISYIESIELNVTYNHEDEPIDNATVRLILNGTEFYELVYNSSTEMWRLSCHGDEIGLGTWNATIIANKTGYQKGQDVSYITVHEDTPVVIPSWTSNSTDYISTVNLYVTFRSSEETPITDGIVEVTVNSETYIGQHQSQGNYSVEIGPELELGNNSMTLYVDREGYESQIIDLYLDVAEANATLGVSHTSLSIYYDGTVNLTIEYSMDNESSISPATLIFTVDGENHSAEWTGIQWEVTLNGTTLGTGIHDCIINTSAYGFVSREETFQVEVSPIPTTLQIYNGNEMYVNDSLTLTVEYLDERTSARVGGSSPSVDWIGTYDFTQNENLTYSLTLHSTNVHADGYNLTLTCSKTGYESASQKPSIAVRRLPLSLLFDIQMSVYENESMVVSVLVNETYHGELVHFAQVNLTLEGVTYALEYDVNTESYRGSIWLNSSITPGDYTVAVTATAIDCQTVEDEISLQVLAKAEYTLTVGLVSNTTVVTEGSALALQAILEDGDGNPLSGRTVVFFVKMSRSDGETVESKTAVTNEEGVANAGFDIPSNTENLEVWARYDGSISEWAADTNVLTVEVRPSPSLIEVLIETVRTPLAQFAILIAIITIVATLAYKKVIKPRREAGRLSLKRQLDLFQELSTLQHFMAIYTEHGTCVIYFPFTEKHIEPDLISGFISAITNVYGEITGDGGVKGTLEEIHYHGLRLNSYSSRFIIGILILESEMSPVLKRRLEFFVDMFESQYEQDLEDWRGKVECFDPEWVLSNLISTLDYYWLLPHKIVDEKQIRKEDKAILQFLQDSLDERGEFCIDEILESLSEKLEETEAETLETLLTLHEEGGIKPISVQTLMTRRGLGLSGVESQSIEPIREDDSMEPKEVIDDKDVGRDELETQTEQPSEDKEHAVESTDKLEREIGNDSETTQEGSAKPQPEKGMEQIPKSEGLQEHEDEMYAFLEEVEKHLREEKGTPEKDKSKDE